MLNAPDPNFQHLQKAGRCYSAASILVSVLWAQDPSKPMSFHYIASNPRLLTGPATSYSEWYHVVTELDLCMM